MGHVLNNYYTSRFQKYKGMLSDTSIHGKLDYFIQRVADDLNVIPDEAYDLICTYLSELMHNNPSKEYALKFTNLKYVPYLSADKSVGRLEFLPTAITNAPFAEPSKWEPNTDVAKSMALIISDLTSVIPSDFYTSNTELSIIIKGISDDVFDDDNKRDDFKLIVKVDVDERACAVLTITMVTKNNES